jgi:hypothetical protein
MATESEEVPVVAVLVVAVLVAIAYRPLPMGAVGW